MPIRRQCTLPKSVEEKRGRERLRRERDTMRPQNICRLATLIMQFPLIFSSTPNAREAQREREREETKQSVRETAILGKKERKQSSTTENKEKIKETQMIDRPRALS